MRFTLKPTLPRVDIQTMDHRLSCSPLDQHIQAAVAWWAEQLGADLEDGRHLLSDIQVAAFRRELAWLLHESGGEDVELAMDYEPTGLLATALQAARIRPGTHGLPISARMYVDHRHRCVSVADGPYAALETIHQTDEALDESGPLTDVGRALERQLRRESDQ
jgi:hypothetical protein